MKALHKHLLAGVVVLGLGSAAFAMPPASGDMCNPDGSMMQGRMRAERMSPAQRTEMRNAWMAKRQAILHDKLKLNAEQETAWKAYIAGATPPAPIARLSRDEMVKLSAPQRMERMLDVMKEHQARMTVRLVELKKFYAVLTPEQKQIFDTEAGPRRGANRGHQRGMR